MSGRKQLRQNLVRVSVHISDTNEVSYSALLHLTLLQIKPDGIEKLSNDINNDTNLESLMI